MTSKAKSIAPLLVLAIMSLLLGSCTSTDLTSGSVGANPLNTQTSVLEIESKFVGTWIGYEMYTAATINKPELLEDYDMEMTLTVRSDGTGSLIDNFSGATNVLSNLSFKPGISGNGYQVYDANNEGVGALEWGAQNGSTEWLVLVIPTDEIVCYSFYKDTQSTMGGYSQGVRNNIENIPIDSKFIGDWSIYKIYEPGYSDSVGIATQKMSVHIDANGKGTWEWYENGSPVSIEFKLQAIAENPDRCHVWEPNSNMGSNSYINGLGVIGELEWGGVVADLNLSNQTRLDNNNTVAGFAGQVKGIEQAALGWPSIVLTLHDKSMCYWFVKNF